MAVFHLGDIVTIQLWLILAWKKADNGSSYAYKRLTLRAMEKEEQAMMKYIFSVLSKDKELQL